MSNSIHTAMTFACVMDVLRTCRATDRVAHSGCHANNTDLANALSSDFVRHLAFVDPSYCRRPLNWRAVAALERLMVDECALEGMQRVAIG